ncbi:protein-L-isoaspartate O-methyltransferase [Agaricicola taiwanensis]|uniref:Protein-L-isoaspartate O-methyltransferase n=1 Tax=Agaricicola taiwanensis TaxID=591372 RepID=A0A8J2YIG3_9RHOB|nr:protein-L-isoaspartate O-methyltransferase [Agaricicola taiwanensis]GGE45260.1 protein-L-isoaspartate O-methyltransferase [Agaricicola taiwanensis]
MNYQQARQMMVDGQIRPSSITDPRVTAALGALPREEFVPASWKSRAYADASVPLQGEGPEIRHMLTPTTLAKLVQAAEIAEHDMVLDVGCGSGYSTAFIARIAAFVVGLEQDAGLANEAATNLAKTETTNAVVVTGMLAEGYSVSAPYDIIIVEGAVEAEPTALLAQLKDGGRLATIVGVGGSAKATVYVRSGDTVSSKTVFDASAPILPGFAKSVGFVF